MKQCTSFKRCMALVLALMLLVSQANLGIVQSVRAEGNKDANTTIAQIIADNYDLSQAEKDLLVSGYLVSDSFGYNIPANDDSLVSVDTENAKITAKAFEGWVPTKAIIAYGDKTMEIALTDGVGTYDAAVVGNAFNVKVAYELNTSVAADKQEVLLGAAAILKQGVQNLANVAAQSGNLYILEEAMPSLVELSKTGVETSFAKVQLTPECKAAIADLESQMAANGGKLKLSSMITEYESGTKTGYLMTKGVAMQAEVASLVEKVALISTALNTIYDNIEWLIEMGMVDAELANQIKNLSKICNDLAEGLAAVNADSWAAANSTGLLVEGVDYAGLDKKVAALGEITKVTVKETLKVAETTVQVNMAMWNVTYTVVVKHVVDNEVVVGFTKQMQETLADGATAAEILAAFDGFDATVLAESKLYVEGKFDRAVTEIPANLGSDLEIVVTYAPKNYTVTINGEAAQYPYGYELTLPVHEDANKSYDYKDANGTYYAQGSVVVIEDNMTFTREEGKAYTNGNLYQILTDNYTGEGSKVTAILMSGTVKGNAAINYREPSKGELEDLVKLEGNTLTVKTYASSYAGLNWAPYSYVLNGNTYFFNGASSVEITEDFETVEVFYRLTMTNYTKDEVKAVFDLVATLADEAEGQKSVMDRLAGFGDQMGQLNKNMLNGLIGMIGGYAQSEGGAFSDALVAQMKATISDIIVNCCTGNDLKLVGIIEGYNDPNNGGLLYYYQNADYVISQISYLSDKLEELLGDKQGKELIATLLTDMNYGDYVEYLDELNTKMAEIKADLKPVNSKIDTTNAAKLAALANALAMEGSVKVENYDSPYVQMGPVIRTADKYVTIEVKVNANGKTNTDAISVTILKGNALTQAQVNELKAKVNAFVNGAIETVYFTNDYNNGAELDALVGQALTQNDTFEYTWTAKEYTVKIEGYADQIVSINDLTIDLPKHPEAENGMSYEFTIGSKTAKSGVFTFAKEDLLNLFKNGVLTITYEEKNANVEKLTNMVETMNADMGFEALTLVRKNGVYTGIEANVSANDMMTLMMGLVMKSGYSYIGLNGEGFIYSTEDGLELSIQTLINALLSDESFSEQTIVALGKNGKGKLMTTTMQLGDSASELHYGKLTFTMNLNSVPAQLTANAGLLEKATSYIKFHGDNGELAFSLNLPDQIYAAYAAALVATGNVAKNDINGLTQKVPVQFLYDYVEAITGSEMDLITYTNTLKMLGVNRDLTDYVSNNTFTKILEKYNANIKPEINDEKTSVALAIPGQTSINALLSLLGIDTSSIGQFLPMLREYKAGNSIDVDLSAKLANVDKTYYALVMDLQAAGLTNKVQAPSSYNALYTELSTLAGYSAVILTADVPGNLAVSGTTVLDLNGFDVNGTIAATGKLIIIDSTMDTYNAGTVANVTGNATILAGNYLNIDSAKLMDGYYMDGTTVRNALYTIKETDSTLSFVLDYESEKMDGYIPEPKALAIDIATDILLNYFMTAKVSLGGYELIDVHADDLVGLYASDDKVTELVKTVMDWFTIGQKGYENNAGFEGIVNMILESLLDFETITNGLKNNEALFSYDMTTAPWDINVLHADGNYATVQVCGNDELAKTVKLQLIVKSGYNDYIANMTEVLADIVVKDETFAMIDLPTPTYGNKTLTVSGFGKAAMVMDMSASNKYAIALGVVLAYGNPAKAQAVANAVNNGDMAAMKKVVDNTSVAEFFTALKKLDRNTSFAAMAQKVGVTVSTADAAELEAKFHMVFCAAGKVLEELDITGMNSKLGGLYNEETGYYELSKTDIFRDVELNARGYSALVELGIDELTLKVKLFADCLWGDANHDGLVNAKDATLILQYSTDTLDGQFFCTARTNVDGVGEINAKDATEVLKHTAGIITKFPVEE